LASRQIPAVSATQRFTSGSRARRMFAVPVPHRHREMVRLRK